MRLNGAMGWLVLVVLTMGMLASLLSVPVWMQNRYLQLMKEQSVLERERRSLEAQQLQLKMELGKLSSMERIVQIAYGLGLVFGNMPIKVLEIPGSRAEGEAP